MYVTMKKINHFNFNVNAEILDCGKGTVSKNQVFLKAR